MDLRSLHSENPYFLFSVMKTARFLAGDHTAFARFQAYAFALRHDARFATAKAGLDRFVASFA